MSANAEALGTTRLLWRVITRFWSARALAEAGASVSGFAASTIGPITTGALAFICVWIMAWSIDERVQDFRAMIPPVITLLGMTCVFTVIFGGLVLLLAGALALPAPGDGPIARRYKLCQGRVALLLPLAAVIPVLAWTPLGLLASIASPSVGVNSGKPAWTTWTIWLAFSPCAWLPALLLLVLWQLSRAIRAARPLFALDRECLRCGYALEGLSSPVCPECGKTADP